MTMTVNPAGIARRKNGAPPPDVPLADIDLGTLEFVYYENCTAAWDAGAAPLDEGD